MIKLGVNIDHVATLRQARMAKEPNIVRAAVISEMAGADGITIHLREDRRHIQDRDVEVLRDVVTTRLNLEMATADDIIKLAVKTKPDMVTLVPEKRHELTTEGGLNLLDEKVKQNIKNTIIRLKDAGIVVSLFIDPKMEMMKVARDIDADYVEIHTGKYSDALTRDAVKAELESVIESARAAKVMGLGVNAGHGLNYENVIKIARIKEIEELNIGHAIVARAVFSGLEKAVSDMKQLMIAARRDARDGKI